jgi:hypothetical protein
MDLFLHSVISWRPDRSPSEQAVAIDRLRRNSLPHMPVFNDLSVRIELEIVYAGRRTADAIRELPGLLLGWGRTSIELKQ